MTINYGITGKEKKRMISVIADTLDEQAVYTGVPRCVYQIAEFTVTRDGNLEFPEDTDADIVNGLIDALEGAGFEFPETTSTVNDTEEEDADGADDIPAQEETANDNGGDDGIVFAKEDTAPAQEDANEHSDAEEDVTSTALEAEAAVITEDQGLSISLPAIDQPVFARLQRLIASKQASIRKALNADDLTVTQDDGRLTFPWWNTLPAPEETAAYMAFISALVHMAQIATRVTATEKATESEKYAFRIFLLRLGFSGPEHKETRFQLMKRLSGHAAFRNSEEEQKFKANQLAKKAAVSEEQEDSINE